MSTIEHIQSPRQFSICIENRGLPWHKATITTEEIIQLGGWDASQGVIEVDEDQTERTLKPGEEIELKPGKRFGKRICWKRG